MNNIAFAGALHDPVAALAFCGPTPAAYTIVGGRVVVIREGRLTTVDLPGPGSVGITGLAAQLIEG